jgi:hypothetical protein
MPIKKTVLGSVLDLEDGTSGFLGRNDISISVPVDLSQFTSKEIDADGYLKPYIPLTRAYVLPGAGTYVYGVTAERVKVADDNEDATIAALDTQDIAVFLRPNVVRAIAEDVLDRAYTADEIAAFNAAGSKSILIY